MTRVRAAARVLAALTVEGAALPVLAGSASASCGRPGFDEDLARGSAIAIVTRTDSDPSNRATLRVERSYGVDLPPTVTSEVSGGMDGRPAIFTGQTAAVVFGREGGEWTLPHCGEEQVGDVLARFDGEPKVSSAGPAVALALGYFGGANLVALDRNGRPVTWNRSERYAYKLALCPGGRTAVTLASGGQTVGAGTEINVYDIDGLQLLRTVRLGGDWQDDAMAMRCADEEGSTVQVLTHRRETPVDAVALLTVDGRRVSSVPVSVPLIGGEGDAQAVPDGFLLLWGEDRELTKISADGRASTLIPGRGEDGFYEFAVADDGRTVAVHASGPVGTEVQVLEVGTGNILARRPLTEAFQSLRWEGVDRLLVRTGFDQGWSWKSTRGHILVLDRELKDVANVVAPLAYGAAPVGDRFITFGRTRLGVMTADGAFEESPELRLVATAQVVAIPGASAADPRERGPVTEFVTAEGGESTDDPAVAILLGMAVLALTTSVLSVRQIRLAR